ncbi:MAG: hypothetical protein ACTSQG_09620 [Promethearchaeota archaeon]
MLGIIHLLFEKINNIVFAVKTLGILFHILISYFTYKLLNIITKNIWVSLVSGVFLAISPIMVVSALSGMEISLSILLGLIASYCYINQKYIITGVFLGLAFLARPEFATLGLIIIIEMLVRIRNKRIKPINLVYCLIPSVIIGSFYLGWNFFVDGKPFPATFYVKSIIGKGMPLFQRVIIGSDILAKEAPLSSFILWIGLLGCLICDKEQRRYLLLFVSIGIVYLLGNLILIPPWDTAAFYHIRYLIPAIPFIYLSLLIGNYNGLIYITKKAIKQKRRWILAVREIYLIFLIFSLFLCSYKGIIHWQAKFYNDCRNINELQVNIGKKINFIFSKDSKIGTIDAGAIRYFGNRYTIDLMGLNTNYKRFFQENNCLDALVLMPAWVVLPREHKLFVVYSCMTKNYQVTSNPNMGIQVIGVTISDSEQNICKLPLLILGKRVDVNLKSINKKKAISLLMDFRNENLSSSQDQI